MNEKTTEKIVEKNAVTTIGHLLGAEDPVATATKDMETLCAFYTNMSIHGLRRMGYTVRVNHLRYDACQMAQVQLRRMPPKKLVLRPMHELRAEYDLTVSNGAEATYNYVSSHGGQCRLTLLPPGATDEKEAIEVVSTCSYQDAYNKKEGVLRALGRAFRAMCVKHGFSRKEVTDAVEHFSATPSGH